MVLTREAGKNGKLQAMLAARGVHVLELPLVETAPGPDRDALPGMLRAGGFDWAVITSPEAAAVFLEGWRAAGCPQARCQAWFRYKVLACDYAAACEPPSKLWPWHKLLRLHTLRCVSVLLTGVALAGAHSGGGRGDGGGAALCTGRGPAGHRIHAQQGKLACVPIAG